MANIVTRNQPQGLAKIDWSNPIAKGLAFAYTVSGRNLVGIPNQNVPFAFDSTGTASYIGPIGKSAGAVANGNYIADIPVLPMGSNFSLFALGTLTGAGSTQNILDDDNPLLGYRHFQFRVENTNKLTFIGFNGTNITAVTSPTALTAQEMSSGFTMGAVVSGTNISVYQNRLITTGTAVGSNNAVSSTIRVAGYKDSATQPWLGAASLVMGWSRPLSDAEMLSLNANPWQLFKPQERWRFQASRPARRIPTTRPCRNQPQGLAKIDYSNPLTKGLMAAYNAFSHSSAQTDLVGLGGPIPGYGDTGTPDFKAFVSGIGHAPTAASQIYFTRNNGPVWLTTASQITLVWHGYFNSATSSDEQLLGITTNGPLTGNGYANPNTQSAYGIRLVGNNTVGSLWNNGNTQQNYPFTAGKHTVVATFNTAGNVTLYLDGVQINQNIFGSAVSFLNATQIYFGTPIGNGTVKSSLGLIFSRELSAVEAKSLSANPWQLFKEQS